MGIQQTDLPAISCIKSTEYSIHTRRCFMTGEYCAQQTNIQKERQKLHDKGEINAFVVMNFSSVSDVVYEARIKPFIKDLKEYLYLCKEEKLIACVSDPKSQKFSNSSWKKVESIHVHRADSNPVSDYIICNRICQQMQMADLIIVDVSVESANVFYEFGLATAFQKLILPICFSDSFYVKKLPEKLERILKHDEFHRAETVPSALTNHIDCFPWRRKLFEHFGIRYAHAGDHVSYLDFAAATDSRYGFSDTQYSFFPYRDKKENSRREVGQTVYGWLHDHYNQICKNPPQYNTLVRYTMDGFLEAEQAGRCIINFYNNMTKPMHDQYCFCGDRVAILGQPNKVWDDPKDSKTNVSLRYNVSDLIRIGMDQATYMAERKRIKTDDYLAVPKPEQQNTEKEWVPKAEAIKKQVKTHIRNRSIPLNPDNPVYVTQYKDGIQKKLDDYINQIRKADHKDHPRFFCLYHIMLDTLRYANELVVDLSCNSIQAMFWLGAAHGSDVYAVTVRHEMSEKEKSWSGADTIDHDRPIFDLGGLWTAMLRYGEMDSFYRQLELIQQGIDQHARLKLPQTELEPYEYEVFRQLHHASPYPYISKSEKQEKVPARIEEITKQLRKKNCAESRALESYYRDRFWRQLLRDNQLHLFLPLSDILDEDGPRLQVIKWDMDTVSELSHYLSKRKVIGKYQFDTLREDQYYGKGDGDSKNARNENFISIGEKTRPIKPDKEGSGALTLAGCINEKYENLSVRNMSRHTKSEGKDAPSRIKQTRGFGEHECQFYPLECFKCPNLYRSIHPQECMFIAGLREAVPPLVSTRFYLDKENGRIKARLQCIGPQKANTDQSRNTIPDLISGSLELEKEDNGEYTVTKKHISAKLDDKTLVSLLNILDLRFSPEQFAGDSVWLNIKDGSPGDSSSNTESLSEIENKEVVCDMYAQLLLWREEQNENTTSVKQKNEEKRTEYKYQVSLIGVSGPATKALTALLVDDEQKERIWSESQKPSNYLPLNTLQTHIRKAFCTTLRTEIGKGDDDLEIAKALSLTYLSTILSQYFLPFLSKSDEKRIYNSLEAFLRITDSKNDPVFEHAVKKHTDTILSKLEKTLYGFRGVDALYDVKVSAKSNDRDVDNRTIQSIELHEADNKPAINYLYVNSPKKLKGAFPWKRNSHTWR